MSTPDAAPPQPPSTPAPSTSRTPWIVSGLLLLAVGVGIACFFIGKSSADTSTKESEAASAVRAEYQPGEPAYEAIYDKGKKKGVEEGKAEGEKTGQASGEQKGKQIGLEQGQQQGEAEGDATGVKNGANTALGGFGGWETDAPYVITMKSGSGNVPYEIASRQPMSTQNAYRICAGSSNELCAIPLPDGR